MNKTVISPLVSVIMPVYNAGSFLRPAIESILNQTYKNFELILIDDASTDRSSKILHEYKKKYPKQIKIISLTTNLNGGGDRCANEGLKIAKGTFIARMDADDIALPTRLEKQVAYLQTHPDIFLVGSNAQVIDKDGAIMGDKIEPLTSQSIYQAYFTFHPLIHPSVMLRSRLQNGEKFMYRIKFNANNDYYTFFSLLCDGYRFSNLEEKLLQYRIHGKNDTFKKMKQKFMNTLKVRIEMVMHKGYRLTTKDILTTLSQAAVMFLLPQSVTTYLYLLSKGIISKQELFSLIARPRLFFMPAK